MTMISKAFASVIAALVLTASAFAEDGTTQETPETGKARYSFHKVDDGFLRLDTLTGEVALCSAQAVGWACLAAPEDRAVLENEIARLRKDNGALKQDLLAHGLALPPGTLPEPPSSGNGSSGNGKNLTLRLPDHADFNRVVTLVGRLWRRLVEAIANAQNQVLHRS
jgi:hypothetical protein